MVARVFTRKLLIAGSFAVLGFSQTAFATTAVPCATSVPSSNVFSCAAGVYANLSVLNGVVGATIGPVAKAFGTAPGAYNTGAVTATLTGGVGSGLADLLLASLSVKTGLITDIASSPYNGTLATLTSTASSTVNNLNLSLSLASLASVLKVTAGTLGSTSTASKTSGTTVVTGSSYITDLSITAAGLSLTNVQITAATPANFDLLTLDLQALLGFDIIANYQSPIYLAGTTNIIGIQTAALAIQLNAVQLPVFGGFKTLSGTVLIGETAASVPETTSWAMMLLGFGLVGAAVRRRKSNQLPALALAA
jgi:hypothetical protein